jgi:hypothetical protein
MRDAPTIPIPPPELVEACLSKQCVLFAGPELSVVAGMPTPIQLAEGMFNEFMKQGALDSKLASSLRAILERGEPDLAVEGIVESSDPRGPALAAEYFQTTLQGTGNILPAVFSRLPRIGFSGVITTNFDDLLERSFTVENSQVRTLMDTEPLLEALSKNEFFLLKLYGLFDRKDTVILTTPRYRDAVIRNQVFGQFLSSLFYSRTLLFAGTGLQGIEDFLASVPSRGSPPRHFAVVMDTERELDVKRSSLLRRFGIDVISCAAGPNGIGRFLEGLANLVEEKNNGATGGQQEAIAARLARVVLENIGPFDKLEIQLDAGWTLLLGDNGVGKSSLLKAICIGIIGEEAAPFASRLVRVGATVAAVTLITNRGDTYRTEIYPSVTSSRVLSIPVRPLEKEGWLSLGFPPLRTVSWDRPQLYEGGTLGRPSAGDLLPLLRGDADPRLDRLKSWLLYLDHNIQSPNTPAHIRDRYRRLWSEFFRVVEEVTPGVKIAPGAVDAINRQVYVQTADGEIPIEALSQGTQSLMGWIGILLERLFEVYGQDEDPTERFALILMDEIDAHMHPAWQHVLIGRLKKLFPNAQFLASSHSALLVSGLSKEEILVFSRASDGGCVEVARPPGDLKGWRIDQILTSMAFGLPGARDAETLSDLERYADLAAQDEPSAPDELAALAARLKIRLPTQEERGYARKAFEILKGYAQKQMESMSDDEKKKMTDEIKVQIQEGITGSRRPM